MARESTITNYSSSINVNFPTPGADNDSQGFRTNFARIQSAFNVANDEISDLFLNSVNLSETNDFGNNVIKKATLQGCSEVIDIHGDVAPTGIPVDFAVGSYHTLNVGTGTTTINVTNWPPTGSHGKVRLQITTTASGAVVQVGGVSKLMSRDGASATYASTGTYLWDVWSTDGGTTVYASEVGQPALNADTNGNLYTAAGATAMTDGFVYIPAAAGVPTGVPTAIAGHVPMYYDITNNKFYVYNGGWKSGTLS